MARYPGATWKPVPWANARDDNTDATIVIMHVTAAMADSQYHYFLESRKACSHFHIALDGTVEQYIDTDKLSAADYEGSDNAISIETAGLGDGKWTDAQVVSIVRLLIWINQTHGIPLRLKTTSSPTEAGIGWHRLGITGNFPSLPSILAGRNQRGYAGEAWSLSGGKVCPGAERILQMPMIIEMANNGTTETGEGFLMTLSDRDQEAVLWNARESKKVLDEIRVLLKSPIKDGSGATGPREIWERTLDVSRRTLAQAVANASAPVDVDVDAEAVAAALLDRLPRATAEEVVRVLSAQLQK